MGAFLHYISGLASGYADKHFELERMKRETQESQKRDIFQAGMDQIKNDPTLSHNDRMNKMKLFMKQAGIKDQEIDQFIQASGADKASMRASQAQTESSGQLPQVPQAGAQGGEEGFPPIPSFNGAWGLSSDYAKTEIQQKAILGRMQSLWDSAIKRVDDLNKNRTGGNAPWIVENAPNGMPLVRPARGKTIPRVINGREIAEDVEAPNGKPIDKSGNSWYQGIEYEGTGERHWTKNTSIGSSKYVASPTDPTKEDLVFYDRGGQEIRREPNSRIVPALVPKTTDTSREQVVTTTDDQGNIVQKKVPLKTERTITPQITPLTPQPTPPAAMGAPTSPAAKPKKMGGVIGVAPAQTTRSWENPVTPEARKVIEDNQPALDLVNRAIGLLGDANDNTPLSTALQRLGYAAGIATSQSPLINNEELLRVIGGARLLKGSTRAIQALQLAMVHTPNVKIDSHRLMKEKLINLKQNLEDQIRAAQTTGQKYPNAPFNSNATPSTPLPTNEGSLVDQLVRKHGGR